MNFPLVPAIIAKIPPMLPTLVKKKNCMYEVKMELRKQENPKTFPNSLQNAPSHSPT